MKRSLAYRPAAERHNELCKVLLAIRCVKTVKNIVVNWTAEL